MRKVQLAFVALILALLLVPGLGLVVWGPASAGANEVPAQMPELTERDGLLNTAYLSELADYVNDGFYARQELITLWAQLLTPLGHSAEDDVILGTDGWLYYAPEIEQWAGVETMTDREIFAAAYNLSLMQEYAAGLSARFAFTIAPDKSSLYPEHLPGYPESDAPSNAERLKTVLDELDVAYVDLFEFFESQDEVLYFEHDSHWNSRGAALAADAINSALGVSSNYGEGFDYETSQHTGDLFEMLYPAGEDGETNDEPTAMNFNQGENVRPDSITIDTTGAGELNLLMFRDSFGELLYPFMAESSAAARFSRMAAYDLTLAEELSSTAVVIELVERNLSWLYEQAATYPAPERELEFTAAQSGTATATFEEAYEDAHRVSGVISGEMDVASPVYIEYNGVVYAAGLTSDGYTICLPGEGGGEYTVLWYSNGVLTGCDISANI